MSFETGFYGVLGVLIVFATLWLLHSLIYEWRKENKVQLRVLEPKVVHHSSSDGVDSFKSFEYEVLDGPHKGYIAKSSVLNDIWSSAKLGDIIIGYCIVGSDGKPAKLKAKKDMYFPIYLIANAVFVLCMYEIFESAF